MSLIIPTPVAPVLTPQQRVVRDIQSVCTQIYTMLSNMMRVGTPVIWKNRDGLTPQQAFDSLGTDAGTLCAVNAMALQMMAATGNPIASPVPENITLTVNPNGTVTLTPKA